MQNNPAVNPLMVRKILIVQFRPFGDVLLATSYLGTLKKHFPHASIDFLVKQPYQEILDGNPYLSRVIAVHQKKGISYLVNRVKLFREIRRRHYDLVIDQQAGTGSGQLVLLSGAPHKLGWRHSRWSWGYDLKADRNPPRYRALQNFDMLAPLGIHEEAVKYFFQIKPESEDYIQSWLEENRLAPKAFLLMSPGSPRKRKKWDVKRYAILADLIAMKLKTNVVLLRAPNEVEDCRHVVDRSTTKPIIAPPTTFNQAAALVKSSKLLICNDGGVNHLSVALGVPSLAIFGNTPWRIWSPQGYFPHHYHMVNPEWKRTPGNSFGISPEETFQSVVRILESLDSEQSVEDAG